MPSLLVTLIINFLRLCHRTVESSRLKCGQYWPAEEETAEDYGDFIVINNKVDKKKDYIVTHLLIQNVKVRHVSVLDLEVVCPVAEIVSFMCVLKKYITDL